MVWSDHMERIPITRMTGLAVVAACKGLAAGKTRQGTVAIMTRGAGIMRPPCSTHQSIIMAAEAVRRT